MSGTFTVQPVAIARTPFRQKFAIPRQAGLVDIPAHIQLLTPFNQPQAVDGLEQVSHIWLTFLFHQHIGQQTSLQVRPPRLGGNQKLGVFASRASYRPNAIGQSVVKLQRIEHNNGQVLLHVSGLDVLDGTPVLDIKPYLPYADQVAGAYNHIAANAPEKTVDVQWLDTALQQLQQHYRPDFSASVTQVQQWIGELIQYDPRPAYRSQHAGDSYAMQLFDLDIHWIMQTATQAHITFIQALTDRE